MARLILDEIVDAFDARVVVERTPDGRVHATRFDLTGLPRLDPLLRGRPVAGIPSLVERLCGICPVAHHLAGVRAIEQLHGITQIPPTAQAIRSLLLHGAAIAAHLPRLALDPAGGAAVHRLARAALVAAGSPGHFPTTAIPGGVRAAANGTDVDQVAAAIEPALRAACQGADAALAQCASMPFTGADVAVIAESGIPDLGGMRLRAVAADGTVLLEAEPAQWADTVIESAPGASAPRPYMRALGPELGRYRVGPVAQLRIGPLGTAAARSLQERWLASGGGARAARAIVTVHSIETVGDLVSAGGLTSGPVAVPIGEIRGPGSGTGWVDGPRGLLVHRYAVDEAAVVTAASILTPTAQNEPWLADLLGAAVQSASAADDDLPLEDAIREADPCLPCSSAPPGSMGLRIQTVELPRNRRV